MLYNKYSISNCIIGPLVAPLTQAELWVTIHLHPVSDPETSNTKLLIG